ncbi:MAG: penicillin-binding transpeptidase domain-containing protein [Spirosomaceae bacterium]|jgi:penicillin-binding protein 2|nr:penicillin-binding transpeptidase domain-containing protein [Spirosomataceae bacterium]
MFDNRKQTILGFIFLVGIIYVLRLFYLQVIDDTFHTLGSTNAIQKEIQVPLRGQIYDRNGRLLVANVEVYDMLVTPRKVKSIDTLTFCKLLGITRGYFDSTMNAAKEYSANRTSLFMRQLSKEDYGRIADAMVNFPGFTFEQSFFRTYPGNTMANALGYIGEIPKKQFEEQTVPYYRKGDYIGLTGLEKYYEGELRGRRGVKFMMYDVHGEEKGVYQGGKFDTLAVIGKNLYSSVDIEVQQLADSLFQNKVGSVVAIEPATGEILAMGSYPTYNPSLLSGREFSKNFLSLTRNPDKPLNNRAVSAFYRPGSTFKLVQAAIGLELGVITPSTSFASTGSMFVFHSGPYEASNLNYAIQLSSNPYFYNVFRKIIGNNNEKSPFQSARIGLNVWNGMVAKFGFGRKLGIDLPSETKGLLPDVARYDKVYGKEQWKFSNIYSLSIGEGELGVNVLKLANLCATLANRGYWRTPHLIKGIGANGKGIDSELRKVHKTDIDPKHFEAVVNGMSLVIKQGTGRASNLESVGIEVCGKTGTSQNKKGKDHAIFIAFAPRYNPKIAVACVVENGGFGGVASAPITGLLIEKYLTRKISRQAYKEQVINTRYTTVAASAGAKAAPKPINPDAPEKTPEKPADNKIKPATKPQAR